MSSVLTIDLGTSATKAGLWVGDGLAALERAELTTVYPFPGRAEQDAREWWHSVVVACSRLRDRAPEAWGSVAALCFAAARESFALVDDALEPLGPGILWSDQRGAGEEGVLGDPAAMRTRTGVMMNAAAHAAKVAWVARHEPERLAAARWVLAPRDLVVARLTGEVVTDTTLASRTGLYALEGRWLPEAHELLGARLPPVQAATSVVGELRAPAAEQLGLSPATVVVLGAGDRACEVLGTGATPRVPVVSWGSTVNVSVPDPGPVAPRPVEAAVISRGALDGFVMEAGLSASGAALGWLGALTGRAPDTLLDDAYAVEPGARGVIALPWLHGARAPWWQPSAHAAFLGVAAAHGPTELARALIEGVALDAARSLELLGVEADALCVAGGGAASETWRAILGAVTGRPWTRRRYDDAASVGARLIAAAALGEELGVDRLNPVTQREAPDRDAALVYREVRRRSDAAVAAVLDLAPG